MTTEKNQGKWLKKILRVNSSPRMTDLQRLLDGRWYHEYELHHREIKPEGKDIAGERLNFVRERANKLDIEIIRKSHNHYHRHCFRPKESAGVNK